MRILVADDDPLYRELFKELLTQWRFEVTVAGDGVEAWQLMQADDPPRLLLLDWMMPRMDGFEVCRKVRHESGDNQTFILIVTGDGKKDQILKVVLAGADDYLIKPFDEIDLKVRLRNAVRVLNLQEDLDELRRAVDRRPIRSA